MLSLHHCSHMRKGILRVVLFLNSPPSQEVNYELLGIKFIFKKKFSGMVPALFSPMKPHNVIYKNKAGVKHECISSLNLEKAFSPAQCQAS